MKSHSVRKRFVERKKKEKELIFSKIESLEEENKQLKNDLSHVFEEICMIHREIHDGQYCHVCEELSEKYLKGDNSEGNHYFF